MLRRNARRAKGSHPVAVGNFASPTGFDKANPNRPKFDLRPGRNRKVQVRVDYLLGLLGVNHWATWLWVKIVRSKEGEMQWKVVKNFSYGCRWW